MTMHPHPNCAKCPLFEHESRIVHGEGEGRHLIVIGEAPGRVERAKGRPFVGRSGEVLREVLRQLEAPIEDVRITNIVKCRPPNNRQPTREEVRLCFEAFLQTELTERPDAALLLLGNTAIHTLTPEKAGVTKLRGEWVEANDGRPALCTFHPAYILRVGGGSHFDTFTLDVQRALGGPTTTEMTEWHLLQEPWEVSAYFGELEALASGWGEPVVLAWDLETSGYRAYLDYILAMSLSHKVGEGWVITEELMKDPEVHAILLKAFQDPLFRWIGHNAKFDQIFTLQHLGGYPKLYADTMMMHLALDERKGTHDLKVLCRDLCGAPDWEQEIWKYLPNREASYAGVPRDVLYKYAAYDADFTLRLFYIFDPMLDEDNVRGIHDLILIPGSETMMWAEFNGVPIDMDHVDEAQHELEEQEINEIEELDAAVKARTTKRIEQMIGKPLTARLLNANTKKIKVAWDKTINRYIVKPDCVEALKFLAQQLDVEWEALEMAVCLKVKMLDAPFSAGSWQKVGTLVYDVMGYETASEKDARVRGRHRKEYSTSSATLEVVAGGEEEVKRLLGLRSLHKLISTYIYGLLPDDNYRIHPRWKMHASVTGRIGCTDPNVMNIPHEAGTRDYFIASPEHALIQADYSQAELRFTGAYTAKWMMENGATREEAENTFLATCYREGRDLHTEVTKALFGDKWGYDERMIAKAYNFGLVYGRSARSIAEAFDIPLREAVAQKESYFARMPNVAAYLATLEAAVQDPGELQNAFGRKRRFSFVDGAFLNDLQRQAKNFMMQSSASDATLLSTIRLWEWFREIGYGRVLVFLHDSVLVEFPEVAVSACAYKMHEIMMEVPREFVGDIVPFKVDVGVGYSWARLRDYDPVKGEYIQ